MKPFRSLLIAALAVAFLAAADKDKPAATEKPTESKLTAPDQKAAELIKAYDALPDAAKRGKEGDQLVAKLDALRDLSAKVAEEAARLKTSHHLRKIAIAVRNYDAKE